MMMERKKSSDQVMAAGSLLLLFAAAFAAGQSLDGLEYIVMIQLKASITFPSTDAWTEADPCDWLRVTCAAPTTHPEHKFVTSIDISDSNINGTLPGSLGVLSQMLGFGAANNRLTGPLPDFANCSNLGMLDVSHNGFTSIPPTLFRNKPSLWSVTLDYNLLLQPWEIPEDLSSCSHLFSFTATSCNVHGDLPSFYNNHTFSDLKDLQLGNNHLSGHLPPSLPESLETLYLNDNNLSGGIPDVSRLRSLTAFIVSQNSVTGPVPESLAGISSLQEVDLSNNHLNGSVPVFKQTNVTVLTCGNSGLGEKGLPC
ncbi:unnamed protein product [Cuscuta epithymum]|uniref:Leucine-rich repeat-containing N-terminal plant-type domain-containing protein n=1 Tax=Cuscuta epithymum TaxID=186058 RepID=A0AAV0F063_9ASTE|nr:unnamed protein product [Cuscuta epithymum]